jgi:hypothetical protein
LLRRLTAFCDKASRGENTLKFGNFGQIDKSHGMSQSNSTSTECECLSVPTTECSCKPGCVRTPAFKQASEQASTQATDSEGENSPPLWLVIHVVAAFPNQRSSSQGCLVISPLSQEMEWTNSCICEGYVLHEFGVLEQIRLVLEFLVHGGSWNSLLTFEKQIFVLLCAFFADNVFS